MYIDVFLCVKGRSLARPHTIQSASGFWNILTFLVDTAVDIFYDRKSSRCTDREIVIIKSIPYSFTKYVKNSLFPSVTGVLLRYLCG